MLAFGTRPEAVKMAPVHRALQGRVGRLRSSLCLTAQHREMLDQVLEVFGLHADRDLDLMRPDQSPADVASAAIAGLSRTFAEERPDLVLVQGDTITTFAAAIAAYLQRIPVGHVEAGLRTGDRHHPFPEEMNRRLTTVAADLHFPPTEAARENLLREGIPPDRIVVTGNTVIDALLEIRSRPHRFRMEALSRIDFSIPTIVVTMHRRESFGGPLRAAAEAMREIARRRENVQLVFPVHRNPNVRGPMEAILGGEERVHLTDPVDYLDFVHLMDRSTLALTDSGGVQEEAPSLDLPVLVMREVTERPEGVAAGASILVGTDRARIVKEVLRLLDDHEARARMATIPNPYGDGRASERIADAVERFLGVSP
ncbi:MAG: UDP-N-acetylglucosamine 2-epimerase (non-hydrolyzing) [Acidobacteriota bacterium]|jgi:UDP-N-acetylglucosamine 2-epimerase (non-hydrolysing)